MAKTGGAHGPDRQRGVLIGKFMPPHRGHMHLVEFARLYAGELTVIVCTQPHEPIPGALRFQWMQEMFPAVRVVHLDLPMPAEPGEHPDFWRRWRDAIMSFFRDPATRPELLFASDAYGHRLAREIDARFVPCDLARGAFPVSASMIRADPMAHWEMIAPAARPWFVRRICIFGPESTGKSTLGRQLARHFATVHAPEYARPFIEAQGNHCDADDIPRIARGQIAVEDSLARHANRLLFCDTNLVITTMWSEILFGHCEPWIVEEANRRQYAHHLLTNIDMPWVYDPQRCLPEPAARRAFFERCVHELESRQRPYTLLSGSMEQRFQTAVRAVEMILEKKAL